MGKDVTDLYTSNRHVTLRCGVMGDRWKTHSKNTICYVCDRNGTYDAPPSCAIGGIMWAWSYMG
jgi:hypothetical protein